MIVDHGFGKSNVDRTTNGLGPSVQDLSLVGT